MTSTTTQAAPHAQVSSSISEAVDRTARERAGAPRRRSERLGGYPVAWIEAELRKVAQQVARRWPAADVDDLTQTGLVVTCELAPRYRPDRGQTFFAFVYLRARGAMIDACRKQSAEITLELRAEMAIGEPLEVVLVATEERLGRHQAAIAALDRLKPHDRDLVVACAIHGVSVADAARRMGIGYKAAWARYAKALERLRAAMRSGN